MNAKLVVTISHQVGSGGLYIGQKLSDHLQIPFLDREILQQVSHQLNIAETEVQYREERLSSFWESFSRMMMLTSPVPVADQYIPTDRELYQVECETIGRIAEKSSAIFLGRCGWYTLRGLPEHFSLLLHAGLPFRVKRVGELYRLTAKQATEFIEENDRDRSAYIQSFTKKNWLDATNYDLCIDTSRMGLDAAMDLVLTAIKAKKS
jgi:CMP/dCMP kinase